MRRYFLAAAVLGAFLGQPVIARAADYKIDLTHSHVLFMVDHIGYAKMIGLFADFGGTFSFDPGNVDASKLSVVIKTNSIQTQFVPRDSDLKGADWFNVTEFPEMTFVGTGYAKTGDKHGTITGNLTLRGVTKPVKLDVTLNKLGPSPLDKINTAGFSIRAALKRSDFGLKTFLGPIGDDIEIIIEIEAKQI